jgi:hypothetical protein
MAEDQHARRNRQRHRSRGARAASGRGCGVASLPDATLCPARLFVFRSAQLRIAGTLISPIGAACIITELRRSTLQDWPWRSPSRFPPRQSLRPTRARVQPAHHPQIPAQGPAYQTSNHRRAHCHPPTKVQDSSLLRLTIPRCWTTARRRMTRRPCPIDPFKPHARGRAPSSYVNHTTRSDESASANSATPRRSQSRVG